MASTAAHRVLVTNDDGIDSPGLTALAVELERRGFEVLIAAPATNMSGAAAAIGPSNPHTPARRTSVEGVSGPAFSIQAPPAMIVIAALNGAFGEAPTAVASGVNAGVNIGRAILHSGTVGAALTSQNLGLPAVAVSLEPNGSFELAARFGVDVFEEMVGTGKPMMANVNVPTIATTRTERTSTTLSKFGAVTAAITSEVLEFQLTIDPMALDEPGTDGAALRAGLVSVTRFYGFAGFEGPETEVALERVEAGAHT
jgi:5'-nucleotidase